MKLKLYLILNKEGREIGHFEDCQKPSIKDVREYHPTAHKIVYSGMWRWDY